MFLLLAAVSTCVVFKFAGCTDGSEWIYFPFEIERDERNGFRNEGPV